MSWGLHKAGFKILAGIDIWPRSLETFKINHPEAITIAGDIRTFKASQIMKNLGLTKGDLDCLVGGPPCQGFSKNVPAAYRFLDDPRNQLFREYLEFVRIMRPKTVLMENVAEIYNAYGGEVREEIINTLTTLGYKIQVQVVFAPDYGIPQRRRRCLFFASRTKVDPSFPKAKFGPEKEVTLFGNIKQYVSAWDAISDLPVLKNGDGYEPMPYSVDPQNEFQTIMRKNSKVLFDHITRKLNDKQFSRISSIKPGEGIKDLPEKLRPKSGFSGAYGRLDFKMLAPTITRWVFHPGSGRYSHPREVRLITIREAARIQTFTDDFRFTGTYIEKSHQIGNAVPPMLTYTLSQNIKSCCLEYSKEHQSSMEAVYA